MNAELVLAARALGRRALLISGPIGSGKTTAVLTLSAERSRRGLVVGGVASPRVLRAGETIGYEVQDLITGEKLLLCSLEPPGIPFRRFFFRPEAVRFANEVLAKASKEAEIVAVDEVGPWELQGGGFSPGLSACLASPAFLVLTVRPHLVGEVRAWLKREAEIVRLDRL